MKALELLRDLEQGVKGEFAANRRVMSFDEYFEAFVAEPVRHARTAPLYVRDCIAYYGRDEIQRPEGTVVRYRIFDCPWDGGRDRLVGQEGAQDALFRLLNNFVREGRVTRLLMLHGPNGSAKTSLIQCIARGLEDYSETDEGAVYRFNWVFPSRKVAKKQLGFGATDGPLALDSFAKLDDEDVDARVPGDLRDHPLLLLPKERRQAIFQRLRDEGTLDPDHPLGEYLWAGDLSPRSRQIVDALLATYHGDYQRVLQHVQVERFNFSRRYRAGVVSIEPQMHVDAQMRQVTMDQGIQSLPPSLRMLSLYEPSGDLVDANRGIVEFNDLLKKPLDAYKYLLATCEKGTVALANAILHLDVLFLASTNERHLVAFKEYQDFASFKGRMDLVRMGYLRDWRVEMGIYDEAVRAGGWEDIVTPHATDVLALWAVLTRMKRPKAERYPPGISDVIARLTPMEKADLYAGWAQPKGLTPEQSRELRAALPDLLAEGQEAAHYEGSIGASPREMKELMLNALQNESYHGLSPLAVFDELRQLVKDTSVYDFLARDADAGYYDHAAFIDQIHGRWIDRVNHEVQVSMGLVSERQYADLFARYILHVSYGLKGEKLYNEATGRSESPDERLMTELEDIWRVATRERDDFRRDLVARVGAWRIDNQDIAIDYRSLFTPLFEALEENYYAQQRDTIRQLAQQIQHVLALEEGLAAPRREELKDVDEARVNDTIDRLESEFGYPRPSIREALGALLRHRYQ